MRILREYFSGISIIGALSLATEKFGLFPHFIEEQSLDKYSKILDVPVKRINIGNSSLIGFLCAANSYGMILPSFALDKEMDILYNFMKENDIDIPIKRLPSKNTAFGNLIATNDRGCVISKELEKYKRGNGIYKGVQGFKRRGCLGIYVF